MVLQDHFRPPLSVHRHWHAFHHAWATYISSDLNQRLPQDYFAEANVQFGIEIDVAAVEEADAVPAGHDSASERADQQQPSTSPAWTVPAPTQTVPISIITDVVEILVFREEGGPVLAAVIELVSPANKDRPAHRDAFVSKCAAYLQQAIGLIVIDVVTNRRADLHTELIARVHGPQVQSCQSELYAVSYRPVKRAGQPHLDIWRQALAVGQPLTTLPLWLRGDSCLPLDLATSYERTCREQRIVRHGA